MPSNAEKEAPLQRRSFLKLMGLGAGALVKPSLLLGSTVQPLGPSGLATNWVVYPDRSLGKGFGAKALMAREFVVSPTFPKNANPHEVFYKAALELRRQVGEETLRRLLKVPEPFRDNVAVVTDVLMPIHTRGKHVWTSGAALSQLTDEDYVGFEVVADCVISIKGWGVRQRGDISKRFKEWQPDPGVGVYSRTGEYPMELPSKIDLGHLMHIDSTVLADAGLQRRLGQILVGRRSSLA